MPPRVHNRPPPTANKVPVHGRERYTAPYAAKNPPTHWIEWSEGERYQDSLKTKSYTRAQSVVESGKDPAAVVYGPTLELPISGGTSVPTTYAQHLTPTDYRRLVEEIQALRNHNLERMWSCCICSVQFNDYSTKEKAAHLKLHQDKEKLYQECPWCGDTNWGFMSAAEQTRHISDHIEMANVEYLDKFWDGLRCPSCNECFKGWEASKIIRHCLAHAPGTTQYCDKCGTNTHIMSSIENFHHEQSCRNTPDRADSIPSPVYCPRCGKNTALQNEVQRKNHQRDCLDQRPNNTWHCNICGINMTGWTTEDVNKHRNNCRTPGRKANTYCQKCGINVGSLDPKSAEWHRHNETCWKAAEPTQSWTNVTAKGTSMQNLMNGWQEASHFSSYHGTRVLD